MVRVGLACWARPVRLGRPDLRSPERWLSGRKRRFAKAKKARTRTHRICEKPYDLRAFQRLSVSVTYLYKRYKNAACGSIYYRTDLRIEFHAGLRDAASNGLFSRAFANEDLILLTKSLDGHFDHGSVCLLQDNRAVGVREELCLKRLSV